jgi:hypothetical protein
VYQRSPSSAGEGGAEIIGEIQNESFEIESGVMAHHDRAGVFGC